LDWQACPPEIGRLTALQELDLEGNQLTTWLEVVSEGGRMLFELFAGVGEGHY
jgi:hypothetical protein